MRAITNKDPSSTYVEILHGTTRNAQDTVLRNAGQPDVHSVLSTAVGQCTLPDLVSSVSFSCSDAHQSLRMADFACSCHHLHGFFSNLSDAGIGTLQIRGCLPRQCVASRLDRYP